MRRENKGRSDPSVLSGMTDLLMTALAIIFVLLLTVAIQTPFEAKELAEDLRAEMQQELEKRLRNEVKQDYSGVEVGKTHNDPLTLSVIVPQALLGFRRDDATLPPDGQRFLSQFIPLLAKYACEEHHGLIESLVIEGHADSTGPVVRSDEYNIRLSQDRSMSVVKASLRTLEGDPERFNCVLGLTSASGRGALDLIRDESGKENPEMSRRVVFKLRMKSLEQRTGGKPPPAG